MDPERFKDSRSGRLVRAGQGKAAYWAFVPDALPPGWGLGRALWRIVSEADRAVGELAGLGRSLPNPHALMNPFIRREVEAGILRQCTGGSYARLFVADEILRAVEA